MTSETVRYKQIHAVGTLWLLNYSWVKNKDEHIQSKNIKYMSKRAVCILSTLLLGWQICELLTWKDINSEAGWIASFD